MIHPIEKPDLSHDEPLASLDKRVLALAHAVIQAFEHLGNEDAAPPARGASRIQWRELAPQSAPRERLHRIGPGGSGCGRRGSGRGERHVALALSVPVRLGRRSDQETGARC